MAIRKVLKDNPKISVIVPVYNVEPYIRKCLDSILVQKEKDFELLLIDDGSTDNSGKICDEYKEKDDRIKVFHKPNGGVASARNMGLDNAVGEWIAFCDPDDFIDENEFTIPDEYNDADVIAKSVTLVNGVADGRRFKSTQKVLNVKKNCMYSSSIDIWRMYVNNSTYVKSIIWGKLFKHNSIKGIRFDCTFISKSDHFFTQKILSRIHRYAFSSTGMYYYVERNDGLVHSVIYKKTVKEIIDENFVGDDKLRVSCDVRPVFVRNILREFSWMLHHKYIGLLSAKRLLSIRNFMDLITERDCVLFENKDFRLQKRLKRNLNWYFNNDIRYKFVVFNELLLWLWHQLLRVPKKLIRCVCTLFMYLFLSK